ncbi:MAG TPA: histidine phosphatase family protein [Dehalococcoidia bacterium]|nr:histidine phosphatase family protein [Dehalococcoidia bacterium]
MAARIILVRHGETDWNLEKRIQGGSSDTILNARGREQAASIARKLEKEDIRAIYSTPLRRGLDTAQVIASYHMLEVIAEPSLREIEAGELEGVTTAELGKRFSEILIWNADEGAFPRVPGGESLPEVQQRCWEAVRRLAAKHPEGALVLVTHYFVILSIICSVLGLPLSHIMRLRLSTGSISIFNLDGDQAHLELFNDTG